MTDDLADPAERERLLREIDPETATAHHERLRAIFRAEMAYRRSSGDCPYFENLYWCAFLLYRVGDPRDVPIMWEAKHINFDTACAFDVQFMLGAGVDRTLQHLTDHGHHDVARALAGYPELHKDLAEWESYRRNYFYN